MSKNDSVVIVRGVERRFAAVPVLRGVDLEIQRGSSVAMFGSNGAGKTTLLRIIAGLMRASRGTVSLFGKTLPTEHVVRGRIGVVAHDCFLYGDLSARENLAYYARLYRVSDTSRGERLLERLGLTAAADRPVRTYSRGMLQRLALARAVLHSPELLLLDEPFTGLDPRGARLLAAMLAELRAQQVTIILTTHDFSRGLEAADAVVLLHAGRVAWRSQKTLPDSDEMTRIYDDVVGYE